jgi:hypothetical protein
MLARIWATALALTIHAGPAGLGQTPAPTKDESARIEALVRKLGSSLYTERESARKQLDAVGPPALDALRKSNRTGDLEMVRRVNDLIANIEGTLLTRHILTPTRLQLKLKDADLTRALQELCDRSGFSLGLRGDAFSDKKITLDTGVVTFWQAFDGLCDATELMERNDLSAHAVYGREPSSKLVRYTHPARRGVESSLARMSVLAHREARYVKPHVSHAGAVKIELGLGWQPGGGACLWFTVSAEPRLGHFEIDGWPTIDKAIDEQGKPLLMTSAAVDGLTDYQRLLHADIEGGRDFTDAGFRKGRRVTQISMAGRPRGAKEIKELSGKLAVRFEFGDSPYVKIDNVMQADGKSAVALDGGRLTIHGTRMEGASVIVEIEMTDFAVPKGDHAASWIEEPACLVDADGRLYKSAWITKKSHDVINGSHRYRATLRYEPHVGQAPPRDLVVFGSRVHTVEVPFHFTNIPLPFAGE